MIVTGIFKIICSQLWLNFPYIFGDILKKIKEFQVS